MEAAVEIERECGETTHRPAHAQNTLSPPKCLPPKVSLTTNQAGPFSELAPIAGASAFSSIEASVFEPARHFFFFFATLGFFFLPSKQKLKHT